MARKTTPKVIKAQSNLALKTDCTAVYIRVSTEKQKEEGFSLDAQREKLMSYCNAHGWTVCPGHVYEDGGISGKTTDREHYQRMLQDARDGKIKRIVAIKLDRLARNVRSFLALVDELQAIGCDLVLIKESFDTGTPHGKFALTMFAAMAELEAATITERVLTGKAQKAFEGGYNGAQCPLGYDYADGKFTPNRDADTVKFIFGQWLAGYSMTGIAAHLNNASIPTQRGGQWAHTTVRYILLNGFYAGLSQWKDTEVTGSHPAIIDLDAYQAAFARVESAKRGNPNFGQRVDLVTDRNLV